MTRASTPGGTLPARGFTRGDSQLLLKGIIRASAAGTVEWRGINTAWRGRVAVISALEGVDLSLEMQIRPMRPSEPTVVYLANGEPMWRIDINGAHQGRRFTHIQTRASSDAAEVTRGIVLRSVELPFGPGRVGPDIYRAVFEEAAGLCQVQTYDMRWTDPPGGSP